MHRKSINFTEVFPKVLRVFPSSTDPWLSFTSLRLSLNNFQLWFRNSDLERWVCFLDTCKLSRPLVRTGSPFWVTKISESDKNEHMGKYFLAQMFTSARKDRFTNPSSFPMLQWKLNYACQVRPKVSEIQSFACLHMWVINLNPNNSLKTEGFIPLFGTRFFSPKQSFSRDFIYNFSIMLLFRFIWRYGLLFLPLILLNLVRFVHFIVWLLFPFVTEICSTPVHLPDVLSSDERHSCSLVYLFFSHLRKLKTGMNGRKMMAQTRNQTVNYTGRFGLMARKPHSVSHYLNLPISPLIIFLRLLLAIPCQPTAPLIQILP